MGLKKELYILPFIAEREMSEVLLCRMRSFYISFAVTVILIWPQFIWTPEKALGVCTCL